jgi:glycosyltransferase involved in cell wall biosynthesis
VNRSGTGSKVRVCQLISSFYPIVGGAETATLRLSQGLLELGMEVVVLTRRYPGLSARETVGGIEVRRLGLPSSSKWAMPFFVLHVLWILMVSMRGFRVLHAQGSDAQLISGLLARVCLGRRLVLTLHSDPRLRLRIRPHGGGLRVRAVKAWVDALGILGPHMKEVLVAEGFPPEKIVELPNSVDTLRFRPAEGLERAQLRSNLKVEEQDLVVVFLGRLIPLKRVDLLLQAWASTEVLHPGVLLILGEGPEGEHLRALKDELPAARRARVQFLGNHSCPEDVLRAADLLVLPSQLEGQSMALLEAMACGLVPIVSDLEANLALVEEGCTGFSFQKDDQASLALALTRAAACDRAGIGGRARSRVCAEHSSESVARTHMELYEVLSSGQD